MKIFFLSHRTPFPPDKGDKIRSYHLLSQLAKRHRISLAYWVDDPKDMAHADELDRICRGRVFCLPLNPSGAKARALWSLARGKSISEGHYYSPAFQSAVDIIVKEEQPDLIYVFSSPMARYVEKYHGIPTIVDFVDVDSDKWGQLARFVNAPLSFLYRLEQKRLARFESWVSGWARSSLFVSQAEADLFRQLGGQGAILSLPNGVEVGLRRLPVREGGGQGYREKKWSNGPIKISFVGTMNYYPNVDAVLYFAREIFPLIRCKYEQAVFEIVGRFPPKSVRRLNGVNGVRVLGEVEDVRSVLIQADVSVAPLRIARGVQNKILEAIAIGIPVVATPQAVQGLDIREGDEILTADTPERFALQVTRLLDDAQLRNQITKRAWNRVNQLYRWDVVGAKLEGLIAGLETQAAGPRLRDMPIPH
jgi:sugar transferase (PEP-CTERM/EpsH1 system associated)